MKPEDRSDRERVQQEAAHWFAVLRRPAVTLEQRAAYRDWIRDGRHLAALAEMQRLWGMLTDDLDAIARSPLRMTPGSSVARGLLVAITCAVLIGLGALLTMDNGSFWSHLDWQNR